MAAGIPEEQHPGFLLSDCRKCFLGEQLQLGSNANSKEAEGLPAFFPQSRVGLRGLAS